MPGDEARVAVKIKFKNFVFIGTHSDLNDEKRKEGAVTVCDLVKDETKPVFLAGDLNDSHRWPKGGISFPVWMKQFKIISDTISYSMVSSPLRISLSRKRHTVKRLLGLNS